MSKQNDNRRKLHVTQIAKRVNKKSDSIEDASSSDGGLTEQYKLIKEDLMKLREDLNRGYDMAKEAVDKKTIINELMKIRSSFSRSQDSSKT